MSVAVIVNADDLGMSERVNEATFALMANGRISSATLMANAPAAQAAARLVARFPQCSFGVHLNLTEFEPLTAGPYARLLVDERGQMSRANAAAAPSPRHLRAAYGELCAQIDRVTALGVPISHLDSHHHVHTVPALFPVLKALQRRYRIRTVRLAKNLYAPDQPCRTDLRWKKRAYNWALRSVFRTRTTDVFTEFLTYYRADRSVQRSVRLIELMVHPGAAYAAEETSILEGDWLSRLDPSTRLISYAELSCVRERPSPRAFTNKVLLPCD